MYINAVAKSVILHLQHDFYNTIFKITHKLYIASGSAPRPQGNILGVHLEKIMLLEAIKSEVAHGPVALVII
jgi:hypothetical protein